MSPVWPHLDIEAAFLHVRRLGEVFKAVVLHCQLFPLQAAGLAGVGVLWDLSDFSSQRISDLIIHLINILQLFV